LRDCRLLTMIIGKTRPLYFKRVRTVDRHINQSIVPKFLALGI
jgi:hypothetical protein